MNPVNEGRRAESTSADTVMTVQGPVPASELGITLPHEHIFLDLWREFGREGVLNDVGLAVTELEDYVAAGGVTLVECTPRDLGRDPAGLVQVAERTGLKIVMGTSYYRHPYIDRDWFDRHDVDQVAATLIEDLTVGAGGTGIRAGIIGEVASEREWITTTEERSFRAAARAHLATGATITTHAACFPAGIPQLNLLESEGVPANRVIIGHCDTVPDTDYHLALARRGVWVEFDTIRQTNPYELNLRIRFVSQLADAGFLDRILMSHDMCLRSHLRAYGGSGYSFLLREFVPRLRANGFGDADIRKILVDNPRRAITGEDRPAMVDARDAVVAGPQLTAPLP
jgi:predicted metal-dependent phosphotriesterase family hydrolase